MRTLIAAALVCAATLCAPAVASAGCLADAGAVTRVGDLMVGQGRIACTTANGHRYQMRGYIQSNAGGWHSINLGAPLVVDFTGPPPVGAIRNGFVSGWYNIGSDCDSYGAGATQTRIKIIVENIVSGSSDPDYGTPSSLGSCHQ